MFVGCVCVCVVFPAQLFFQNKKPLTLSPPQKKNTRTNPHLQHGNVSKVASDLFILQGIEAHSLPSAINTGPGNKKKLKKTMPGVVFSVVVLPQKSNIDTKNGHIQKKPPFPKPSFWVSSR